MIKLTELVEPKPLEFPDGFKPAKVVPEGGVMCTNCGKWNKETQLCEGKYYIKWNGDGSYDRKIGGAIHTKMMFGKVR